MSDQENSKVVMSEEFIKVIKDFVLDIHTTFPEFQPLIHKWWKNENDFSYVDDEEERKKMFVESQNKSCEFLFDFCNKKLPPRFFDILYQNEEMFKENSDIDTEFLPHIHFKNLWNFEISQKTRETIWKYLQLLLFSIIGTLKNKEMFGDTAKLFEGIDESEFKNKLEETLSNMQNLFNFSDEPSDENSDSSSGIGKGSINMENIPNAEEIHDHITGMLDGNLGRLAKEIAEETASELDIDMENVTDAKSVFSNLMKNPSKLMGLVKNVGDKLDKKIKSGEIKESELISEAGDIMNKMKNIPGMGDIQSMLSKMGLGGKGGNVNMNAMQSQLTKNMKNDQMKERMKEKMNERMNEKMKEKEQTNLQTNSQGLTDEQLVSIFSTGEKVEKTPRRSKQENNLETKKDKKGKKPKKG